jgi:hypothetical protein
MLDPIVQRLPFRFKCLFFAYTLPGFIYAGIALCLCSINPFWFRQAAFARLENQIEWFGRWRNKRMQKYYDKYSLLANIKNC